MADVILTFQRFSTFIRVREAFRAMHAFTFRRTLRRICYGSASATACGNGTRAGPRTRSMLRVMARATCFLWLRLHKSAQNAAPSRSRWSTTFSHPITISTRSVRRAAECRTSSAETYREDACGLTTGWSGPAHEQRVLKASGCPSRRALCGMAHNLHLSRRHRDHEYSSFCLETDQHDPAQIPAHSQN